MHIQKHSDVEIQYLENKENISPVNKKKPEQKNLKKSIKPIVNFPTFSLKEGNILTRHLQNEKKEIRTVSKYKDLIFKHEISIDKEVVFYNNFFFEQRTVLVNWITGLQENLHFSDDALYFCIHLIDLALSKNQLHENKCYVFGVVCILIAQKYEETEWKSVEAILLIARKHGLSKMYKKQDVLRNERQFLNHIEYNVKWQNPLYFLRNANRANSFDDKVLALGKYFLEIMFYHEKTYSYSNRVKAATAVLMARKFLKKETNENLFNFYTNTEKSELYSCFMNLREIIERPPEYQNIRKKYQSAKKLKIYNILYN
ncbi:cdc13 [Ecytonucleospora hepatopenaei]|uniref:Cdc13 n=1 Tax=Ecytonucleospora hepatopenaei TaxID=646526 RepID=A0A1W0E4N4_9MICR|nr:cdc13 [Ecytonucleospora hepatopenaei]